VAYGSLLQERRRCLHGRIVKALEALARDCLDDQVERLAYHALQGAVWDGALAYLRHAGDKAMARSAHQVAVGYFEQALGTLAHLPEQRDTHAQAIDLHLALRTALIPLGDPARLFTHRRAAEALAAQLGDGDRQGRIATYWTRDLGVTGHHEQAVAYGQRALTLLHGDVVLRMTTQLCLSYAYY
jgi:predicted ATPase